MPSSHLNLCRPLLHPPPILPSIRVFSNESTLLRMRWAKYWSFSFSISLSLSNEHPGLISFRMDWLDLLAVQGTLKSLLQHHSSKTSILWHSAFFIVQFSLPYMTIGKTIALTRWTFVGKVMSLLLNMLSRLVITFLPSSNYLYFHYSGRWVIEDLALIVSLSVLPMFSSKSFPVSGLTFRSSIHFEFIFLYGARKCSNFIFLLVTVQNMETYINICKIESQWEFSVYLRKLKQGLYINLQGLGGEGRWEGGAKGRGYIYIYS